MSGMYAEFATCPRTCHVLVVEDDGDRDLPPSASTAGALGVSGASGASGYATKSPTPMSGKHVIVGATSPGRSTLSMRLRRRRMLRSTWVMEVMVVVMATQWRRDGCG